MKKNTKFIFALLSIILILLIACSVLLVVYLRRDKGIPSVSDNSIEYEYSPNNLLGLRKIIIDNNKYIYQFSSIKYLNKSRILKYENNQSGEKAIGIFRNYETGEIEEVELKNIEIVNSCGKTYITVEPPKEKGDYLGMYLYFKTKRKRIEVLYEKETVVAIAELNYEKNQIVRKSQKYNKKWDKKTISKDKIDFYR